jgi:adenylate kinase
MFNPPLDSCSRREQLRNKQESPKSKNEFSSRRVILITGTPCVGKTTLAQRLSIEIDGLYVNLTELAKKENLIIRKDKKRDTIIVDEGKMRSKLRSCIKETEKAVIIDGHYAAAVVPKKLVSIVFVLRRDPRQLQEFMKKCGFSEPKMHENLESEILDVCLVEAIREQDEKKVCELNVTDMSVEESLAQAKAIIKDPEKCRVATVDWIGMLEEAEVLDEFLKT